MLYKFGVFKNKPYIYNMRFNKIGIDFLKPKVLTSSNEPKEKSKERIWKTVVCNEYEKVFPIWDKHHYDKIQYFDKIANL